MQQATPALCLAEVKLGWDWWRWWGQKKKGRVTPLWVLSAAVDVEARMKEGDGQQAELHPPLPFSDCI